MGKVTARNWTVPEEWRTKRRCTTAAGTVGTVLILIVIFNATTTAASKSLPNTNNNSRGVFKLKLFQFQAKSTVLFELKFLFCKKKRCQMNCRIRHPSSLRLNRRGNLPSSSSYNWTSSCLFVFSWKQKTLYYSRILFHNFRSFATKRQTHSAQPEDFFPNKISSKHNPQRLKPDKIDYNYPLTTKKKKTPKVAISSQTCKAKANLQS